MFSFQLIRTIDNKDNKDSQSEMKKTKDFFYT